MKIEEKTILWKPVSEYTGGRVLATNGLDILIGELNPEGDCVSEDCSGTHLCGITHFAKIDGFFPTLRESEDEKIRKALIDYFDDANKADENPLQSYGIHTDKAIAWLEKRSEPTDINPSEFDLRLNKLLKQFETLPKEELASSLSFYLNVVQNDGTYKYEPKFKVGDIIKPKDGGHEPWQIMQVDMLDKKYRFKDGCVIHFSQEDAYELIERKPADKVEPKFKYGDRVRNKKSGLEQTLGSCIGDIYEGAFPFFINDQDDWELIEQKSSDNVEPKFKLDDWVVYKENTYQIHNIGLKQYYECLRTDGTVHIFDFEYIDSKSHLWSIKDAKDGDVLVDGNFVGIFKENNYNPSDKSGCMCLYCSFHIYNDKFYTESGGYNPKYFYPATKEQRELLFQKMKDDGYEWDAEKLELKEIEQKPVEWHREDEQNLNACLGYIPDEFLRRWLMDAIHTKYDKPAWSEEDETGLTNTIIMLKEGASLHFNKKDITKTVDWLKSLKERVQPQNIWKPNNEQMKILLSEVEAWTKGCPKQKVLESLYNDLKKLK